MSPFPTCTIGPGDPPRPAGLTDRQWAFVGAILADRRRRSGRAAAVAGYAWPDKQGPRLMQHSTVAAAVRAGVARLAAMAAERRRRETAATLASLGLTSGGRPRRTWTRGEAIARGMRRNASLRVRLAAMAAEGPVRPAEP